MSSTALEQILSLAEDLSSQEKIQLIEDLARQLRRESSPAAKAPFPSLWGVMKHLGPGPSAEEIDEARREAWANFPREDP